MELRPEERGRLAYVDGVRVALDVLLGPDEGARAALGTELWRDVSPDLPRLNVGRPSGP